MCEECVGGLCVSLRLVGFISNHRYAIMVMTAVMVKPTQRAALHVLS